MFKVHTRGRTSAVKYNPWSDLLHEQQVAELAERFPDAIYFEV